MNTWTPLFSKIVDSSIWTEPDDVVKVFLTMLALKDADQVVRYNAFALGQRAHKTEAEVLAALKVLAAPDHKRIEPQPFDGRRIQKVEGGWLLLNGQHYEDMMRAINRRAYKAGKEREYRAKRRAGVVTGGPPRERLYAAAVGAGEEPDGRLTAPVPGEAARKGTGPCGQSLA